MAAAAFVGCFEGGEFVRALLSGEFVEPKARSLLCSRCGGLLYAAHARMDTGDGGVYVYADNE